MVEHVGGHALGRYRAYYFVLNLAPMHGPHSHCTLHWNHCLVPVIELQNDLDGWIIIK